MYKLLLVLLTVNNGFSVIPDTVFKDVPPYLTDAKEAINSGLIHNLRFLGNLDVHEKHVDDVGNDGISKLLILLFPSPEGILATQTMAHSNFGRTATPEIVASLLSYAEQIREIRISWPHHILFGNAKRRYQLARESVRSINNSLLNAIDESIKEECEKSDKSNKTLRHEFFEKGKKNAQITIEITKYHERQKEEQKEEKLYPDGLTDKIILAFFCHLFNTKEDILKLLQSRGKLIPDPNTWVKSKWDQESLVNADPNRPDTQFARRNCLFGPIPFKSGVDLSPHGICPVFDRSTDSQIPEHVADCAETTHRYFSEIMFFNPTTRRFEIPHGIDSLPLMQNLVLFMESTTEDSVQDGSSRMRYLFNRVVGDLNKDKQKPHTATYRRKDIKERFNVDAELEVGFLNFLAVWEKLLGIDLFVQSGDLETDLKQGFEKLVKILNPSYKSVDVEVDLKSTPEMPDHGEVRFTIMPEQDWEFSFSLRSDNNNVNLKDVSYESKPFAGSEASAGEATRDDQHPLYRLFGQGMISNYDDQKRALQTHDLPIQFEPFFANILRSIVDIEEGLYGYDMLSENGARWCPGFFEYLDPLLAKMPELALYSPALAPDDINKYNQLRTTRPDLPVFNGRYVKYLASKNAGIWKSNDAEEFAAAQAEFETIYETKFPRLIFLS